MITTAVLLTVYLLGLVTGMTCSLILVSTLANRSIRRKLEDLKESTDIESMIGKDLVVTERMARVKEITLRQIDLQGQIEQPQRSGLDGKHKNLMGNEIKALEEEKVSILHSILADGHDPVLTVGKIDGTAEQVKLSEFLSQQGLVPAPTKKVPKKIGKFVVYSNNKDDGKSNA